MIDAGVLLLSFHPRIFNLLPIIQLMGLFVDHLFSASGNPSSSVPQYFRDFPDNLVGLRVFHYDEIT